MTYNWMKWAAIGAMLSVGATGCATTSVTMTSKAAPITYKIGKGDAQYASLPKRPTMPRTAPRSIPTPTPVPRGTQDRTFDPDQVDRTLYAHQRVGKRYTIMGRSYTPKHDPYYDEVGEGSWYGPKFHGKPTATGEIFNKNDITAAHKTLPLNSMLYVTNLETGQSIMVRLNDRGPFIGDRIIDLSEAAADAIGYKNSGLSRVRVQYAGPADPMAAGRKVAPSAPRSVALPNDNLSVLPQPSAPSRPAPKPNARAEAPRPAPVAPSLPQATQDPNPIVGGNVTLTIKGPIHIARTDESGLEPEFLTGGIETVPESPK